MDDVDAVDAFTWTDVAAWTGSTVGAGLIIPPSVGEFATTLLTLVSSKNLPKKRCETT